MRRVWMDENRSFSVAFAHFFMDWFTGLPARGSRSRIIGAGFSLRWLETVAHTCTQLRDPEIAVSAELVLIKKNIFKTNGRNEIELTGNRH